VSFVVVAGTSVAGCGHQSWTMADASELPSTCPLAAAAGKTSGKAEQTTSGLPAVADHRASQQFSSRHSPEIA